MAFREERRNAFEDLFGEHDGKGPLRRLFSWEDDIKKGS